MKTTMSLVHSIANIAEQPRYTPEKITRLMKKMGINERGLALILNLNPITIRRWVLGSASPCNPSSRLLQLLELDPGIVDRLADAVKRQA